MTREEYLARLATEPATANQRGAIMGEFARLGLHYRRDRAERLAACAVLLGIAELGTIAELTQGQAGQLVNLLQRITDRAGLPQGAPPAADDSQPAELHGQVLDEPGDAGLADNGRVTWPQVTAKCLAILYAITRGSTDAAPAVPGARFSAREHHPHSSPAH